MIQLHKDHLLIACKYLQRVADRKSTNPALACVRIEPAVGETRLLATDLDRAIHITIPSGGATSKLAALRAKKAGAFLVDCSVLANAAATADADSFLGIDRDHIQVRIGGQASAIPVTMPEETFDVSSLIQSDWIAVSGQFDLDTLKRLLRVVSRDEARYAINGICWDKEGILISTDGRRLLQEPFTTPPPEIENDIILPADTCRLIPPRASVSIGNPKAGENIGGTIAFVATEKILTIRIFSRLVNAKYPNWRQVLPQHADHSLRINNDEAAANLRKIAKIAAPKKELDHTLLRIGSGRVTFEVRKDGTPCGSFTQAAILTGSPTDIAFNTNFLIDALEIGGDTFAYRDESSPAIITGVKPHTQILMPMRTAVAQHQPEPEPEPEEVEA